MVKVIIERDGVKKELTGEMTIGVVMSSRENGIESSGFMCGNGNAANVAFALSNVIPDILIGSDDDKIGGIMSMEIIKKALEKRIREELKGNADDVADMLKNL